MRRVYVYLLAVDLDLVDVGIERRDRVEELERALLAADRHSVVVRLAHAAGSD